MKSADSRQNPWHLQLAPRIRALLFAVALVTMTSTLVFYEARAQLDGAMMEIGSRAMMFPGAEVAGARTVRINGIALSLRSTVVDAPLDTVLGHYRSVCAAPREVSGGYSSIIASLATRSRTTDRDGYVACVRPEASDLETLVARLRTFSNTWDLGDIGSVRYAYATRASERPEARTFLITVWTDSSVDLHDLLPLGKTDAKGTDPNDVPRPSNSQRVLSAPEVSASSSVYVYLANGTSAPELLRVYREALPRRGWRLLERSPGESLQIDGTRIVSAYKGGRTLSVLTHAGDSATAVVTLLVSEVD